VTNPTGDGHGGDALAVQRVVLGGEAHDVLFFFLVLGEGFGRREECEFACVCVCVRVCVHVRSLV
jgi:hypothetical protein